MQHGIAALIAEQNTPDEMIVFMLISVVLLLALAFLLYTLVLALLWRGRLRSVGSLRKLLFPSGEQLRAYLGDYTLAAATSLLLVLTVAARHDAVQTVLSYRLKDLGAENVTRAFPALPVRPGDLASAAGETDSVARTYAADLAGHSNEKSAPGGIWLLPVQSLLVSVVQAGQPERAADWLKWSIRRAGLNPWTRFPERRDLVVLAVLLLVAYVGWFAWNRGRAIESSGKVPATEYLRVAGRLLAPAVCIALLLVSAIGASDPERVAGSAAAAAARLGPPSSADPPEARFAHAIQAQDDRARSVDALLGVKDSLALFLRRLAEVDGHLRALGDSAAATRAALAALDASQRAGFDSLGRAAAQDRRDAAADRARLVALTGRVDAAETTLQELSNRLTEAARQAAEALRVATVQADSVRRLGARVDRVERGLVALQRNLEELASRLPNTGLLLVSAAGGFRVVGPGGRTGARESVTTLLELAPGRYQIPGGRPAAVDIRAGHATTVVVPVTIQ